MGAIMKLMLVCAIVTVTLSFSAALAQDQSKDLSKPWERVLNIRSVAFSPDGLLLAGGMGEPKEIGEVAVWDAKTHKVRWTHKMENGVPTVAFSPDNKILAVGSYAEDCLLLDAGTGRVLRTLSGHGEAARGVAFSPDGKTLAVASFDQTVRLWDHAAGKLLHTLKAHTNWVYGVAYSPDGKTLASCSSDRTVRMWDAASGKLLRTWDDYGSIIRCVAFDPKGQWLVTPCWDGTVKVRDYQSNKVLANFSVSSDDWVAIPPGGNVLALGGNAKTVQILPLDLRPANAVEQKRIGELMSLWENDSFDVREKASQDVQKMGPIAEPFLTKAIKESSSPEVRIRARDALKVVRMPQPVAHLKGHHDEVLSGVFSPDGQIFVTGGRDGLVVLWNAVTWKMTATLQWPTKSR